MDRVVAVLLTLLVALIGADRINLLAGAGSFILTPFLALAPAVLGVELIRLKVRGEGFRIPTRAPLYFLVATGFLCVVSLSALLSGDPTLSAKRSALLIAHVHGSLLLALVVLNQKRPDRILARGAYLGIALMAVFNVLQVYFWITGGWTQSQPETELFINMTPREYGTWLPRLSGTVIDQGRAGLVIVVYLFLILLFGKPSKLRAALLTLGVLSLIGTLARAAILCALISGGMYWLWQRRLRFGQRQLFVAAGACAALVVLMMAWPLLPTGSGAWLEPLQGRFSLEEGSTRVHLDLIEHGVIVATSSAENLFFGIGYGNGLMVLEEFFPGNRYANFHSYYVTLLTESGVVALALGLLLLFYPFLVAWGPFVPLIAGLAAFNVFYQSTTEPAFWLVLAFAWVTAGQRVEGFGASSRKVASRPDHFLPMATSMRE